MRGHERASVAARPAIRRPAVRPASSRVARWVARLPLSLLPAALACGESGGEAPTAAPPVPEAERYGGTVVIAGAHDVGTFNPAATTEDLSWQLQRHVVLMTLLRADASLEPVPYLAESWEITDDSTEVVFRLRRDIRWHDGEPTTAADVAFTFALLKNPEAAFPNADWFQGWEGAEILDRHSIRFAVRPRAGLLAGWTRLPIMPRHLLGDAEPSEIATHPFGSTPTGNGPFRFVESRNGDTWVFEANAGFPEDLGGRPYADRVVYRTIPEPSTQIAELRRGDVHFVRVLAPAQVGRARALAGVDVVEYPSRAYGFIAWNGQRRPFSGAAMRRALTMAIDRRALVDAVRNGLGQVANGPIGPWHPAHDEALDPVPYAPDSARAALERAGWSDADGDGVRERGGDRLSFELLTSENEAYRDIAEIVQAQLAAVGVDVDVRVMEGGALIDRILSPERRFDAFVLEWEPDFEVDDRQLFSCAAVGQAFQFASYCSEELEPILEAIPAARSPEDSRRLIREYARIVNRDVPFTFLYFARDAAAKRQELRGVAPDIRGDLSGIAEWWLHPDARGATPEAARASSTGLAARTAGGGLAPAVP